MSKLSKAFEEIRERERAAAIEKAIAEHGFPEHLYGLFGLLWAMSMDVPEHSRCRDYVAIMRICDDIFDMDPVNEKTYEE